MTAFRPLLRVSILALTLLPLATRAQNVVNPGFEDPGTSSGGFVNYTAGNAIGTGGWTVGGSDVFVLNTTYTEPSGGLSLTFNSSGGNNALDITGSGNTGANTISEILSFQPGQFVLSFDLGRINDTGSTDPHYIGAASVSVSLGGLGLGTFTNTTESVGSVAYTTINAPITINTAGNYALTFTNATPVGNNYAGLDNITVNVVPEPSTWVMMAGGLGLALGVSRCRRRLA